MGGAINKKLGIKQTMLGIVGDFKNLFKTKIINKRFANAGTRLPRLYVRYICMFLKSLRSPTSSLLYLSIAC